MPLVPAEDLDLNQGAAFDETWSFFDDEDQLVPTDFTGVVATLRIGKDTETAALITLTSVGKVTFPTDGKGLYLSPGVLRIYIDAATLAALTETQFAGSECGDSEGQRVYLGLNTLEFTKAGVTTRENQGLVRFSPYVEPAP